VSTVGRMASTLTFADQLTPQNIVATLDSSGGVAKSWLHDGIDHPLRMNLSGMIVYYEIDLAGNVRRLRDALGDDLGGYRYTAFGEAYAADATTPAPAIDQPLMWKGRWFSSLAGGIYDVRARQWSPGLGVFLQVDLFEMQDPNSVLWGWAGQNPVRRRDPSGHDSCGSPYPCCAPGDPPGTFCIICVVPPSSPLPPSCSDPCDTNEGIDSCNACCDFYGRIPAQCKEFCC